MVRHVGIRVDVTTHVGETLTGLMTHKDLEEIVGDAIAAFAHQMIQGNVPNGVFFPEEVPGAQFRKDILAALKESAITYSIR